MFVDLLYKQGWPIVISLWRNSLPLEEYATSEVVIYFYNGGWIPIIFSSLKEAIELYYRVKAKGNEVFIFPPHLKPWDFSVESTEEKPYQINHPTAKVSPLTAGQKKYLGYSTTNRYTGESPKPGKGNYHLVSGQLDG